MIGRRDAAREHGRAIIEAAKDHLAAALDEAPEAGWTPVDWADATGLRLEGSAFPHALVHHLAPVLVSEGRARLLSPDAAPPRYGVRPQHAGDDEPSPRAMSTAAPRLWGGSRDGSLELSAEEAAALEEAAADAFPEGVADEGADQRPKGHRGAWIP